MKVCVAIPTYNSAATIGQTLESVFAQTYPADEIIVLDDGSSDETPAIVGSWSPRVILHRQQNQGVANARNVLCGLAKGDLVAFLDHDDLWHPRYLETQRRVFEDHLGAGALFTAHRNFSGYGSYEWTCDASDTSGRVDVIDSLSFFTQYNKATGLFGSMSFCCLPKRTLAEIGANPFRVSGVDDSHLFCLVALTGRPVIYSHAPLVAYRLTSEAQSHNKVKAYRLWVEAFEVLESRFAQAPSTRIQHAFRRAFAAKRRSYAKILMGCGEYHKAREQFRMALRHTSDPVSLVKSLGLLASAYLPTALQPEWPSSHR